MNREMRLCSDQPVDMNLQEVCSDVVVDQGIQGIAGMRVVDLGDIYPVCISSRCWAKRRDQA